MWTRTALRDAQVESKFFRQHDVLRASRELLGKVLVTDVNGQLTAGRIVETEAYRGPEDKASHAWGNRRTARTETMFSAGGVAYIYLCYGIHHLFNVVIGPSGLPLAVLIRGLEPVVGVEKMLERRGMDRPQRRLTAGPGTLSQALGLHSEMTGHSLTGKTNSIWIADVGPIDEKVEQGPRIGVDYAGSWARVPWRFYLAGNKWVSK